MVHLVFIFLVKISKGTKINVSGGYERSSTNGCVQGFEFCIKDAIRINALSLPTGRQAMPRNAVMKMQ